MKSRLMRTISLIMVMLFTLITSIDSLTNGPIQKEFEPAKVGHMVDPATGNFSYSIPLGVAKVPNGDDFNLVLNYTAGIRYGQEASWVGLGWSLNVGSINRIVNGFPDDYCNEVVRSKVDLGDPEGYFFRGTKLVAVNSEMKYGFPVIAENSEYARVSSGAEFSNIIIPQNAVGTANGYLYNSPAHMLFKVDTYDKLVFNIMNGNTPWTYQLPNLSDQTRSPTATYSNAGLQKLEYSKYNEYNLSSQDIYKVNVQGLSGTFKPYSYKPLKTYSDKKETEEDGLIGKVDGAGNINEYFNTFAGKFSPDYIKGCVFKMVGEKSLNLVDDPDAFGTDPYSPDANNYVNIDINTTGTRIDPIWENKVISGFIVTTQTGYRYYFTLPLYSYQTISYSTDNPPDDWDKFPDNYGTADYDKGDFKEDLGTHAKTWLLTAVTGPDYIKTQNDAGWSLEEKWLPHDGDLGYWIAFRYEYDYNIFTNTRVKKAVYAWRDPYDETDPEKTFYKKQVEDMDPVYTSQFGLKEITYLTSIETSSDFIYFQKASRHDRRGVDFHTKYPRTPTMTPTEWNAFITGKTFVRETKRLAEIQWFSKAEHPHIKGYHHQSPKSIYNIPAHKTVVFKQDYILGQGSPNSVASTTNEVGAPRLNGRLTLTDLHVKTIDNAFRPFNFLYQEPDFKYKQGLENMDFWGFANNIQTQVDYMDPDWPKDATVRDKTWEKILGGKQSDDATRGVVWNLAGIITPKNNFILVVYERDYAKSIVGTMYKMKKENLYPDMFKQTYGKEITDYHDYYIETSYDGNKRINGAGLNGQTMLGKYLIAVFSGEKVIDGIEYTINDKFYSYKIVGGAEGWIQIDKKINFEQREFNDEQVFTAANLDTVFVIKDDIHDVWGEDIRVSAMFVKPSFGKGYFVKYNYGAGGKVKALPENNFPPELFTTSNADKAEIKQPPNYVGFYDFSDQNNPDPCPWQFHQKAGGLLEEYEENEGLSKQTDNAIRVQKVRYRGILLGRIVVSDMFGPKDFPAEPADPLLMRYFGSNGFYLYIPTSYDDLPEPITLSEYDGLGDISTVEKAEYISGLSKCNQDLEVFLYVAAGEGDVYGAGCYFENDEVTIYTEPGEGWEFLKWTFPNADGPNEIDNNVHTFTITSNMTFYAHFRKTNVVLTTAVEAQGQGCDGIITRSPPGADLGGGRYQYEYGTEVELNVNTTGIPCEFDHWQVGSSTSSSQSIIVTMKADGAATAYLYNKFDLTLAMAQGPTGKLYIHDGNDWVEKTAERYKCIDRARFKVEPDNSVAYEFEKWVDNDNQVYLTKLMDEPMLKDRTFTASLKEKEKYKLIVNVEGPGSVTPPSGQLFYVDQKIIFMLSPDPGCSLKSKSGNVLHDGTNHFIIMPNAETTVSFTFAPLVTLTTSVISNGGNGYITPPSGSTFFINTPITLEAKVLDQKSRFLKWSKDAAIHNATNPVYGFLMDANKHVEAEFVPEIYGINVPDDYLEDWAIVGGLKVNQGFFPTIDIDMSKLTEIKSWPENADSDPDVELIILNANVNPNGNPSHAEKVNDFSSAYTYDVNEYYPMAYYDPDELGSPEIYEIKFDPHLPINYYGGQHNVEIEYFSSGSGKVFIGSGVNEQEKAIVSTVAITKAYPSNFMGGTFYAPLHGASKKVTFTGVILDKDNDAGFPIRFRLADTKGRILIKSLKVEIPPGVIIDKDDVLLRTCDNHVFKNIDALTNSKTANMYYPEVEVSKVDFDKIEFEGKTVYNYYTWDSECNGKKIIEEKEFLRSTVAPLNYKANLLQIYDRSQLIGLPDKITYYNSDKAPVKSVKYNYAFSEDLSKNPSLGEPGAYFGAVDSRLNSDKPLGMIRERSMRVDGNKSRIAITDVMISKPFLASKTETVNGVNNTMERMLFDARTGSSSLNLLNGSADEKKIIATVPFTLIGESSTIDELESQNLYSLNGASILSDLPTPIATLSSVTGTEANLREVRANSYFQDPVPYYVSNVLFDQKRFNIDKTYVLETAASYQWPASDPANWVNTANNIAFDKYSRLRTSLNGEGEQQTVVYHPRMNKVCAKIINADYRECGVYTCDYEEKDNSHADYFDYDNLWKKEAGAAAITDDEYLYGNKSLEIDLTNMLGISNIFSVEGGKKYLFTIWAKVTSGSLFLYSDQGTGDKSVWPPTTITNDKSTFHEVSVTDGWEFVSFEVTTEPGDDRFVKISLGNSGGAVKAYVQDIRFYPEDAHVTSFYYDPKYGGTLCQVSANNNKKSYLYNALNKVMYVANSANHREFEYEYGISGVNYKPIKLSNLEVPNVKLVPDFSPGVYEYEGYVNGFVDAVCVKATMNVQTAHFKVNDVLATSGEYSDPIDLETINNLEIKIYEQDQIIVNNEYNIKIIKKDLPNVNMYKVDTKGKYFQMGCNKIQHGYQSEPFHNVAFHDHLYFWIDRTEVTQKDYTEVMQEYGPPGFEIPDWATLGKGVGDNLPAYNINWYEAALYCNAKSKRDGLVPVYTYTSITNPTNPGNGYVLEGVDWLGPTAIGYRLPTEAEWELCARQVIVDPAIDQNPNKVYEWWGGVADPGEYLYPWVEWLWSYTQSRYSDDEVSDLYRRITGNPPLSYLEISQQIVPDFAHFDLPGFSEVGQLRGGPGFSEEDNGLPPGTDIFPPWFPDYDPVKFPDWGIYDMMGNVAEWCNDWFSNQLPSSNVNYYREYYNRNVNGVYINRSNDPNDYELHIGPEQGDSNGKKVYRGGSIESSFSVNKLDDIRSGKRFSRPPEERNIIMGFRCVVPVRYTPLEGSE